MACGGEEAEKGNALVGREHPREGGTGDSDLLHNSTLQGEYSSPFRPKLLP